MATSPRVTPTLWTWSAVGAGVLTSLIVQVLLTILGLGIGMLSVDVPTANDAPTVVTWAAFVWWAVSGVFAAFLGGTVAAAMTSSETPAVRAAHSLAAWALAVLIVVCATASTAGNAGSVLGGVAGPSTSVMSRMDALTNPARLVANQPAPTRAQVEQARRHFGYVMLASFLALLCGASAAYAAGISTTRSVVRDVVS
jgi:hypothetical protein